LTEREQKLVKISDKAHQELVDKGLIYRSKDMHDYVNRIGLSVVPESVRGEVEFNFFILKKPEVNAFAMPNGNIYLHVGLLAKLENEAELGFVLAHEVAHVVERHSYRRQLNRHNTVVTAHVADLLLFGTGLAYLPAGLDLASHSRDHETRADAQGFKYLNQAGYDLGQAEGVFTKLVDVKHQETVSSFWSSHPNSLLREKAARSSIEQQVLSDNRKVEAEVYKAFRRNIAELNIKLRLSHMQFELAEDAVNSEISRQGDMAQWQYYLGETYRLRANNPEAVAREHSWLYNKRLNDELKQEFAQNKSLYLDSAIEHYRKTLQMDKNYSFAKKGLGLVAYSQKKYVNARQYFDDYLHAKERRKDHRYIKNLIKKIGM